jgi:hypothetical protein
MTTTINPMSLIYKYSDRISGRPECFSGRSAKIGDIGPKDLEDIYRGMKIEYGEKAAKAFVQMIYQMPDLAATKILQNYYSLCRNNFELPKNDPNGIAIYGVDEDGGASAMATVMSAFGRDEGLGDTERIRSGFLANHKDEYETDKKLEKERSKSRRSNMWGGDYGD